MGHPAPAAAGPYPVAAAPAAGAAWILRCHFAWADLEADTWGDGTESITPSAGTVEDPVDWVLENADQADSWGPNGATGVDYQPSTGSGDWYNAADPACMAKHASVASLIGSTPTDATDIIVLSAWTGALNANYQGRGHALREGDHVFQSREQWDTAAKVRCWKGNGSSWSEAPSTAVATWTAIRLRRGFAEFFYGTGAVPTTGEEVLLGTWAGRATDDAVSSPSKTAPSFNMAAASVYLFSMLAAGATTLTSVCTDTKVWEAAA